MRVIFLSYLLANAHHTAVAVPPPPSVWFPTETTAEQRPPRIESKKESNDWAQFGSVQIPSIAVSDHPSTRRKTNDGESNNAVERATTKALHSHPEIFPATNRRRGDGSLEKITENIKDVEKKENLETSVEEHMSDSFPSIWAGDDEQDKEKTDTRFEKLLTPADKMSGSTFLMGASKGKTVRI